MSFARIEKNLAVDEIEYVDEDEDAQRIPAVCRDRLFSLTLLGGFRFFQENSPSRAQDRMVGGFAPYAA